MLVGMPGAAQEGREVTDVERHHDSLLSSAAKVEHLGIVDALEYSVPGSLDES